MTIVGFALAVWSTTSAATTLMKGSRARMTRTRSAELRSQTPGGAPHRLALVLGAALVVVFLVLGPHLERWLGSTLEAEPVTAWMWWTLQWPILVGGLLFASHRVVSRPRRRAANVEAGLARAQLTAVVIWVVASGGFALYARASARTKELGSPLRGRRDARVAVADERRILFGAEVNAEAERIRGKTESHAAVL